MARDLAAEVETSACSESWYHQAAIDDANKTVSHAEAIKKFSILDTDFTIDTGELTPTMKLKRNVIHDAHKEAIADLYT